MLCFQTWVKLGCITIGGFAEFRKFVFDSLLGQSVLEESCLFRDGPFDFLGGGGPGFFVKKIFWFQYH